MQLLTAQSSGHLAEFKPKFPLAGEAADAFLGKYWLTDPSYYHQLQLTRLHGGEDARVHVWPLVKSGQMALAVEYRNCWSVAVCDRSKPTDVAARFMANIIPPDSIVTAPEPLASQIAAVWNSMSEREASLTAKDMLWKRDDTRARVVLGADLPTITSASKLGIAQAANEMAQCWFETMRQFVEVREFEFLLQTSEALLSRENGRTKAFYLYTPLDDKHVLVGGAKGAADQLSLLFDTMCRHNPHLLALAAQNNKQSIKRLEEGRFKPTRLTFGTYSFT